MCRPAEWLQGIDSRWWLTAFWLFWCTSTAVMLLPAQQLPAINIWDKAEHAGTFFVLMLLAWLAYRQPLQRLACLLIAYGIAIECIQFFIPSRSFSVLDIVADTTGVLPAWWIATQAQRP